MEDVIAHARSYVKAQLDSILIGTFFGTPNEKFKLAVEEKENELLSDPGRHFEGYNDLNEQQKTFFRKEIGRFVEMYLLANG
ncbi:MAG TPA: hypothetical protein DDY13_04200 [Cytophagales bacterium]|jgi:hypothetical protein|nr:hypothetical protein [Cytophagales bacterium]